MEKIEKVEQVKKELATMSTEENAEIIKKYYDCLIDGDVDGAFDITMKMYSMFSAETMAWVTYVLTKVTDKISDYYYNHSDDDEFVKKTEKVQDLVCELIDEED